MKILVIRFSSLGDIVLTTALFPNLKARWPDADVTVLTKAPFVSVFDNNPHVDHVRMFDPARQSFTQLANEIRQEKYDIVIDLHGNLRSWTVRLFAGAPVTVVVNKATLARYQVVYLKRVPEVLRRSVRERILDCLKPLDVPLISTETQLFPKPARTLLEAHGIPAGVKLIGIAPGAKHKTKRWIPIRFAEAANRLGEIPNSMVVLLGDKSDRPVAEAISSQIKVPVKNLVGWTSLAELMGIVSHLSVLLTNDSALMHIGEALKIPLVAVFGPTVRPLGFAPYRDTSRVAEVINLSCRPCTFHGDEKCPLGHHKCMNDIETDAVLFAASDLLKIAEPESTCG